MNESFVFAAAVFMTVCGVLMMGFLIGGICSAVAPFLTEMLDRALALRRETSRGSATSGRKVTRVAFAALIVGILLLLTLVAAAAAFAFFR